MSFASTCKDELIRVRLKDSGVRKAQLAGLTLTTGGLRLGKTPSLFYTTENLNVAKHIASLAGSLYEVDAIIERKEQEHRRTARYSVVLSGEGLMKLCEDTGALYSDEEGLHIFSLVSATNLNGEEQTRAFLRGCFLGSGSCVDPKRSYHLEILSRSEPIAMSLVEVLRSFYLKARRTKRKERYVVYLKDGDDVTGFLALIGANVAAMDLENVRVEKDMRNYINRTSNCETANLDKQVVASLKQQNAIRTIERHMSINELPTGLKEAALLRVAHPNATLAELAEMADIQKSGMNHRLTRLIRLAEELEGNG